MSLTSTGLHDQLLTAAIALSPAEAGGVPGRVSVPEPLVKTVLAELGVSVPRSLSQTVGEPADQLTGPLVLKAWGPGLLHKSDVGAVRLGVPPEELLPATAQMRQTLADAGISPWGFLVEEQH